MSASDSNQNGTTVLVVNRHRIISDRIVEKITIEAIIVRDQGTQDVHDIELYFYPQDGHYDCVVTSMQVQGWPTGGEE